MLIFLIVFPATANRSGVASLKPILWILAPAVVCCGGNVKEVRFSGDDAPRVFVQTILIKHHSEEYSISATLEGTPSNYTFEGNNDVGNLVLEATWDGKRLDFDDKEKLSADPFPLDSGNVAVDLWRIVSEWSVADIKRFNKTNDPKLPEDNVTFVHVEKEGIITVEKKIIKKSVAMIDITYTVDEINDKNPFTISNEIVLKNHSAEYEIIILQMPPEHM